MQKFKTIITELGLKKITELLLEANETLELTYVALGDGAGKTPEIDATMTELVNEVHREHINNIERIDEKEIRISTVLPYNKGGFYIRELGILDKDGDLIAIGTIPTGYKPTIDEGATKEIFIDAILRVENSESISLEVNPFLATATKNDIQKLRDELLSLINSNEGSVISVNDKIGKVQLTTADIPQTTNKNYLSSAQANKIKEIDKKLNIEDALTEEMVEDMLEGVPEVFHDLPQNTVTEDMVPQDFKHGISICSQSNISGFPTIYDYGISITFRGVHASYAQLFITRYGDIWARRSGIINEWNGEWYNAKKEIAILKKQLDSLDIPEGVDLTEIYEILDNKADKEHTHSADDIHETFSKNFISTLQKLKIDEIDNKADKDKVVTSINGQTGDVELDIDSGLGENGINSSTSIIVSSYDSYARSRENSDIILSKGQDFSEALNRLIEDENISRGVINITEGHYTLNSNLRLPDNNQIQIVGQGEGTILQPEKNNLNVRNTTLVNLQLFTPDMSGSFAPSFYIQNTNIENCYLNGGITATLGSKIINSRIDKDGVTQLDFMFRGVFAYNIVEGELKDSSSASSMVEYNLIRGS